MSLVFFPNVGGAIRGDLVRSIKVSAVPYTQFSFDESNLDSLVDAEDLQVIEKTGFKLEYIAEIEGQKNGVSILSSSTPSLTEKKVALKQSKFIRFLKEEGKSDLVEKIKISSIKIAKLSKKRIKANRPEAEVKFLEEDQEKLVLLVNRLQSRLETAEIEDEAIGLADLLGGGLGQDTKHLLLEKISNEIDNINSIIEGNRIFPQVNDELDSEEDDMFDLGEEEGNETDAEDTAEVDNTMKEAG